MYKPSRSILEQSEPTLQRQQRFIYRELQLDAEEAGPGAEEAQEIERPQRTARLLDRFHLLLEDGAGGVPG